MDELETAFENGSLVLCTGPNLTGPPGGMTQHSIREALVQELCALAAQETGMSATDVSKILSGSYSTADSLTILRDRFGSARFEVEVERIWAARSREERELVLDIAELARSSSPGSGVTAIYTTGLDRTFERALAATWPVYPRPRPELAQRRQIIFKLRGTLYMPQTWVLTGRDIHREFRSRHVLRRRILQATLDSKTVLFLGFDVRDELLAGMMGASGYSAEGGPCHYICTPTIDRAEISLIEQYGLIPISKPPEKVIADLREQVTPLSHSSVAGGAVRGTPTPPPHTTPSCPYPGLRNFTEAEARYFFGREAEIGDAASRLGSAYHEDDVSGAVHIHCRWLAVEGPSGVGKSSFVRAGLIPALRKGFAPNTTKQWLVATMRPGVDPLLSLADALLSLTETSHNFLALL